MMTAIAIVSLIGMGAGFAFAGYQITGLISETLAWWRSR